MGMIGFRRGEIKQTATSQAIDLNEAKRLNANEDAFLPAMEDFEFALAA